MKKPLADSEMTVKSSNKSSATQAPESDLTAHTIAIEGIDEPVINTYFTTLNAGDFQATSQLFASEGVLQPPFEESIVGPEAIAAYLEREAKGFLLKPRQGLEHPGEKESTEIEVIGVVQTPWFSVNVRWSFTLTPEKTLLAVKVKLLAAMQDLLQMRSGKQPGADIDRQEA